MNEHSNLKRELPAGPAILEIEAVRFEGQGEMSLSMNQFSSTVGAGELVKVSLQRRHDPRDAASLLIGLHHPPAGSIRYAGQDWLGRDYTRHFQMRSQIGRVFAGSAWIHNLTVRENLWLSMSHHGLATRRIKVNVKRWVQRLAGPRGALVHQAMRKRPSSVEPSILQICQFVRAVCNQPRLLLLERPFRFLVDDLYDRFVTAIDDLRSKGTGVVWFAGDGADHELAFRGPIRHWPVVNDVLIGDGRATS
ncbi:hypothetical protein NHH03_09940 [Stieleria sp. TO1_6]|uniref:ATP-binding cassette domain-containing protein n=1 Tax=Stieleria tagensis TaxID=2956795 RepID=UPI00209B3083|nr:ATP-binding cassette domain-containing protein [Stieleria tagensis]MCO8122058.1 hypothetical protein [Stieleria tagensis]